MAFPVGSRLGPYEILSALGAGGMGEVYRARDTRLGRDVAIKIVSDGFGHDPERLARFQREAHLLAALNHPHIAAIYGLEEANGSQFLVLELVEGETLAERLTGGALPISEALSVARQIADALQAAHEKGIIHRDLKPANVAFTVDGQVKVLDFGLAKELETIPSDLTNSPTMTLGGTQAGVILGTAAYMSPEQAKGRAADKRSDVWAFGCVLYEMLTGSRAFDGDDVSEILAAVLRGEPDWDALPTDVPSPVRLLLQSCLQRDRNQRIADISTAQFVLAAPGLNVAATARSEARPTWRLGTHVASATAGAALVVAFGITAGLWMPRAVDSRGVSRLNVVPSSSATLTTSAAIGDIAITPDGTRVIYTGTEDTLVVRALDQLDPMLLTGLGGAPQGPFTSPDNQWVGFVADTNLNLKKVSITGGPAVTLLHLDGAFSGGTWGSDGTIVFATANPGTGLQRLGPSDREPTLLTTPNREAGEADHSWPHFLPGGEAVLFTIRSTSGDLEQAQVAVLNLTTGAVTTLIRGGTDGRYLPGGYLVYGVAGGLRAVAFDLARLAIVGVPVPVVSEVVTHGTGAVDYAVAANGTIVYVPGIFRTAASQNLVWVDRPGREELLTAPARVYANPRLSPDETQIAHDVRVEQNDIWIWDLKRNVARRLTLDPGADRSPVWTPDGQHVIFGSAAGGGVANLFRQAADGSGSVERLTESRNAQFPTAVSPDGMKLVFDENAATFDIMVMTLDKDRRIEPLIRTPYVERNADISPDGRWIAYESNRTGSTEVFVRPFPRVDDGIWQVSLDGGARPLWAKNGRPELFYLAPSGALMSVRVEPGPGWRTGRQTKLFDWPIPAFTTRSYDVSRDGRFLMMKEARNANSVSGSPNLVVVQHFDEELKRLVPTK